MHRLLKRQLAKVYPEGVPDDEQLQQLVALVDMAYGDFVEELTIIERSLDISSAEATARNTSLNALLAAMPDTCLWLDADNTIQNLHVVPPLFDLLGSQHVRSALFSHELFADRDDLFELIAMVRASGNGCSWFFSLLHQGQELHLEARISRMQSEQILIVLQDVTIRHLLQKMQLQALNESKLAQTQLQNLIDAAPIGMLITNINNEILMSNQYAHHKFNCSAEDLQLRQPLAFIAPHQREKYLNVIADLGGTIDANRVDVRVQPEQGAEFDAEIAFSPFMFDGQPAVTQAFLDITERKKMERQLLELARLDPLTGIYNRRYFNELAGRYLEQARQAQADFSLLVMDLDKFKSINDRFGHAGGDEVLKRFCTMVQSTLTEDAVLGRYGGEEFVLALPNMPQPLAYGLAQTICDGARQLDVCHEGQCIPLSVSVGLVSVQVSDHTLEGLLNEADKLLYCAKNQGRNRVVFA